MSLSLESTLAMIQAQSGQRRAQQAQQSQSQQSQQQGAQATSGAARCPCPATMAQTQQPRGQALSQFAAGTSGSGADASTRTQTPAMPEQQPNPAALYAGEGTATPLARAQADNNLKSNQDLINHAYKQGGGTWAGASRVAQQLGVNLNDLVKNRQGRIGSAQPAGESSPVPSRPGQSATQAPSPATTPTTTGATAPSGADLRGSTFGRSIAGAAEREARRMNSVGRCALGVNNALISQGVPGRGHAYQKAEQLARNPRFREVNMSPSQLASLPAGAVVVWGKSAAKPYGHVSVALGDGREASDHVARQIASRGRYGTDFGNGSDPQGRVVRVFIPN